MFAVFDSITMKLGLQGSLGLVKHLAQAVRK